MTELDSSGKGIRTKKFIPGIAWFFLVLVLICLPGDDIPTVDDWLSKIYFDKWVHVALFGILAFLFMFPFIKADLTVKEKWQIIIRITLATVVWGLATEFIQNYFVTGRHFDLYDWSADSFGALIALLFSKLRFLSPRRT